MAVYGNRQLGLFFSPVVEIRANGFIFEGRQYVWSDVKTIEILEGSGIPIWGSPTTALIRLWDGARISIKDVGFEKRGEPLTIGYSCAFEELMTAFRAAMKQSGGR